MPIEDDDKQKDKGTEQEGTIEFSYLCIKYKNENKKKN